MGEGDRFDVLEEWAAATMPRWAGLRLTRLLRLAYGVQADADDFDREYGPVRGWPEIDR